MKDLKNLEEKENSLFGRKEIEFELDVEKAPSNEEIKSLISEKLSENKDFIKIKGIYGGFGSKNFRILSYIYKSKEDYEKAEGKIEEKPENKPGEEEKGESPGEKEEKPVEQKEEKPVEKPEEASADAVADTDKKQEVSADAVADTDKKPEEASADTVADTEEKSNA